MDFEQEPNGETYYCNKHMMVETNVFSSKIDILLDGTTFSFWLTNKQNVSNEPSPYIRAKDKVHLLSKESCESLLRFSYDELKEKINIYLAFI